MKILDLDFHTEKTYCLTDDEFNKPFGELPFDYTRVLLRGDDLFLLMLATEVSKVFPENANFEIVFLRDLTNAKITFKGDGFGFDVETILKDVEDENYLDYLINWVSSPENRKEYEEKHYIHQTFLHVDFKNTPKVKITDAFLDMDWSEWFKTPENVHEMIVKHVEAYIRGVYKKSIPKIKKRFVERGFSVDEKYLAPVKSNRD